MTTDPALAIRVHRLEQMMERVYEQLGLAQPDGGIAGIAGGPAPVAMGASPRVLELAQAGKTIDAIKAYREETGVGLAEAKHFVEGLF